MTRDTIQVDAALQQYLHDHSLGEHPAQAALREATRNHPHAGMQIGPEQGQFMGLLLRLMGARRAIEIELVLAPAIQTLDARLVAGEAGRHDFAFIDADKSSYDGYYERCLQLLRPGGLIALDNTLWGGAVARPAGDADTEALQALNDKLHRDPRIDLSLLPIGDGLTLARKR